MARELEAALAATVEARRECAGEVVVGRISAAARAG
jgi:hypothetical protein